jgi:hypothetical protein
MGDQIKQYTKELVNLTRKTVTAFYYEKISVDGTVKSLTVPDGATYAEIQLDSTATGAAIRVLMLGTAGTQPSTTDGLGYRDGTFWDVTGYQNLLNFRVTRAQAGTHTLYIQYFK